MNASACFLLALLATPAENGATRAFVQDGKVTARYSLGVTTGADRVEWIVTACTARGAPVRIVIVKANNSPTIDMSVCPGGDPARLRAEDCFSFHDLPEASRSVLESPKPSSLTVGGQKMEFFLEDAQSATVRSWLADLWSRADARLMRDLSVLLALHIRSPFGLPAEALSTLLVLPPEIHPEFSKSKVEVKTEGVEPCK